MALEVVRRGVTPDETLMFGVAHSNNAILGKLAYQKLAPAALVDTAQQLGIAGALPGTDLVGTAGTITIPTTRDLAFAFRVGHGEQAEHPGDQPAVAGDVAVLHMRG